MTTAALTLGTKGLTAATPLASGELLISGYLTRWSELDREGERMVRGAFTKSIPAFLGGSAPLVYHHSIRDVIGKVLSLSEDAVGVRMTARVHRQTESSPLRWVYDALKAGGIKGLSVGAIFERLGASIIGADIVECSVTAAPVLASAGFEVVSEGKALEFFGLAGRAPSDLGLVRQELAELRARVAVLRLDAALST